MVDSTIGERHTLDSFRINVLDIVAEWEGYPLQDSCPDEPPPAQNAGVLQLKCFINNICPFTQVETKDVSIVFNSDTLANIMQDFPPIFRNVLTTTPGTEGVHFTPRYVFRHNYMYKIRKEFLGDANLIGNDLTDADWDTQFEEITDGESHIAGVDQTRYKKHQSWVSLPSFFDTTFITNEGEVECTRSKWSYDVKNETDSNVLLNDIKHDFKTDTYNEFLDSVKFDEDRKRFFLKEDTAPVINYDTVQMPAQQRTRDDLGEGVHWRVRKRTQLYWGEDFFIRFYKNAKEPSTKSVFTDIPKFNTELGDPYNTLDVTNNDYVTLPFIGEGGSSENIPINLAVKPPPASDEEIPDTKYYDFSSQAYYIIELGYKDPNNNYFIIITERTFPIFVNIQNGISRIMGNPFGGVSGAALINADFFNMTVRNHLSQIVIQFEAKDMSISPWIIAKDELEPEIEDGAEFTTVTTKPAVLTVPSGYMLIHGGNLKAGFVFGPLQYSVGEAGFIYPPKGGIVSEAELNIRITSEGDLEAGEINGRIASPFSLPLDTNHSITFSLPEIDRYSFTQDIATTEQDFIIYPLNRRAPMFTQDAQYFRDYDGGRRSQPTYGTYYYRETLKEIGYTAVSAARGKTSALSVRKHRRQADRVSGYESFDLVIHMLAGDHVFPDTTSTYTVPIPDTGLGVPRWIRGSNFIDEEWLVGDCKTPVMTGIRLLSSEGTVPRWNDGTVLAAGMAVTPFDNSSPYFVDATDHVMSYSDSWSATEYTQIEHTGSINFLLGTKFNFGHNVTDKLLALQNKTFYIEIWAGYKDCNYTKMPGMFKMFTGMCHGGSVTYEYGKNIMSCQIVDFTNVLKDMLFFNSPFFDGMRDINAINQIMSMAGFRWAGPVDPASLIRNLTRNSDNNNSTVYFRHIDGRPFKMETYILPSAYARLEQPMFKFDEGSSLLDGILDISKKSAKVFFFDQMGIAHYEELGDLIEQDFQGRMPLESLYSFTSNPMIWPGQQVFSKVEHSYAVSDIFNHIKMMSNTPDMHILLNDRINYPSLNEPDFESFVGYKKTFYQQEGLFGSKQALLHATHKYTVMFKPYVEYKFETYGLPLRANDIVKINNETVRVMNVSHELDAATNKWWMTLECKRYQPIGVPMNRPGT